MTACLCATDYDQVFALIQTHTGLRIHNGRGSEIAQVVDDVLATTSFTGVNDLMLTLQNSSFTDPLWQSLIQALTVGETYFFRDEGQIDALRSHILPQIIAERQRAGHKELRLWSAGCASGEEPYSLVMLLYELLPDIDDWHITVLGTDINLAFLERARRGVYRASSFRNETPDYIQKRWFRLTPEGYQLDPAIHSKVTFVPLNLVNTSFPQFANFTMNMDLIVCRNVTIYFDQATVCEVVSRFHRALNDTGRLVVGHSELSTTIYREFSACSYGRIVYYQKGAVSHPHQDALHSRRPRAEPPSATHPAVHASPSPRPVPRPVTSSPAPAHASAEEPHALGLEAAWCRAKQAADREQWDEALAALSQVESHHVFRPEFHYLRGLVQMAAENAEQALWAWRQTIYCDPAFALAHYSLGELFEGWGEPEAAARHWRQALAAIANLDPQHGLLFSEELTVEMLKGLLTYRLSVLPSGAEREQL